MIENYLKYQNIENSLKTLKIVRTSEIAATEKINIF